MAKSPSKTAPAGATLDGIGSMLSTVSGPSSVPPPSSPGNSGVDGALLKKMAGGADLAAAMPTNPNKA
ncbi:MAG: hypothetical protein ACRYGK_19490, partial [Janthinobacterium lividum]